MTTITHASTSPPQAAPVLDLDARMALRLAGMGSRLDEAAVAFEVRTAHIASADPIPEVAEVVPLTPTLAPASNPYTTPIAAALHLARQRMETAGWCTGARRNQQGAMCLDGAIRAVARSRHEADDACVLLLEAIRRDFRDADSVPSWNDWQSGPRFPLLYLDRAAQLADARGI